MMITWDSICAWKKEVNVAEHPNCALRRQPWIKDHLKSEHTQISLVLLSSSESSCPFPVDSHTCITVLAWKPKLPPPLLALLPPVVQSPSHARLFATPWMQHTRPPCPSRTPRDCPSLCPLKQWCYPTISSSVVPFSSCLQSFPSIRVFSNESALHIRWAKYWSFGISPMNIQGLFPLGLTGLLSLQSKGLSRVFSNTTV